MNVSSSAGSDPEETGWESPFESFTKEETAPEETDWLSAFGSLNPSIPQAPTTFGKPETIFPDRLLEEFERQDYSKTCAIRCQEVILHKYGFEMDEKTLVYQAFVNGWYDPDHGTLAEHMGMLLEDYGIHVHQYEHASTYNLAVELAQGHEVMIGVDSTQLRHPILAQIAERLHVGRADHAVILSGIDTSNPEHVQVIVSDPDTRQTAACYPMERFVSAWKGSDFFMSATDAPPPQDLHLPEMEHFDYDSGHIEEIADMPYDEFLEYADNPEEAEQVLQEHHQATQDDPEVSQHGEIDDTRDDNYPLDIDDDHHSDSDDTLSFEDSYENGNDEEGD